MQKRTVWVAIFAALSMAILLCRNIQGTRYVEDDILAAYVEQGDYGDIHIEYPLDESLFPPELLAPVFAWKDPVPESKAWLLRIGFDDGKVPLCVLCRQPRWTPNTEAWNSIKCRSVKQAAQVLILGVASGDPVRILSHAKISFSTSVDPVGAPLFYREVELPFVKANRNLAEVRWRFGSIASPEPPPVVLTGLPVCGNCHSFSADGKTIAMDVDYASNKGSYVITDVKEKIVLASDDIIAWNDYAGSGQSHGLLSQLSPDGRYVISTVEDLSVFVPSPDLDFSQLFCPVKGILCVFDRNTGQFNALPGADDPRFVQTNPVWSPDGHDIVFARAKAPDLRHTKHQGFVWLTPLESKEFAALDEPFQFDLYRVPFNGGQGGVAAPLAGASHNGMSNYFPRYSPDGRWIVFCQAQSYMLLQPDSALYIVPAVGGQSRRLRCNTQRMNSWHSWSPNGKWLVFASKAFSDYTQLCLTHIDEHGYSTPALRLDHLSAADRAANIPEFVNVHAGAITQISERFLNN